MRFWRPILLTTLLVWAGLSSAHCYGVREDELRCEEAVARLADCCPGFDTSRIDCAYYATCNGTHRPDIPITEARCIAAASCATVDQSAICERVLDPTNELPVCP